MARYQAGHKGNTRAQILQHGQSLLRERGIENLTIESVMRAAGLTGGGFYAHFSSKEELVAELLSEAFKRAREVLVEGLETITGRAFMEIVGKRYLSREHRDQASDGCPGPATLSELARGGELSRRAMTASFEEYVRALESHLVSGDRREQRRQAIALLALCMGGISLSRAVDDSELSDEILRACRRAAGALAGHGE